MHATDGDFDEQLLHVGKELISSSENYFYKFRRANQRELRTINSKTHLTLKMYNIKQLFVLVLLLCTYSICAVRKQ